MTQPLGLLAGRQGFISSLVDLEALQDVLDALFKEFALLEKALMLPMQRFQLLFQNLHRMQGETLSYAGAAIWLKAFSPLKFCLYLEFAPIFM